jgi:hypothetical protein
MFASLDVVIAGNPTELSKNMAEVSLTGPVPSGHYIHEAYQPAHFLCCLI